MKKIKGLSYECYIGELIKNCCILSDYEWILDLFDGAEAVGGGGGPVRNNSSM